MTIRTFEAFAGIGSQAEALKELGLDYVVVGISEIDKHAIKGYEAIHGPVKNYGDITKIEHLPKCDLLTFSWPCQTVSVAGRQTGMKEGSGTTSSLLWEVIRLLKDMWERKCLPEVLLAENVDAVLNQKNIDEFKRMVSILSDMGYTISYTIMNAKDYGTPQNRRRMFLVATLTLGEFIFPEPCPDGRVLRDVLEDNVPESFFLSEKRLATFQRHKARNDAKGNGFSFQLRDTGDVAGAISTNADRYTQNWVEEKNDTVKIAGELNDTQYMRSRNVMSDKGIAPTITAEHFGLVTPKVEVGIEVAGDLNWEGRHESASRVYGKDGVSPTLPCGTGGGVIPKIDVVGTVESGAIQGQRVFGGNGVSPTVLSRDYKEPAKVLIEGKVDSSFTQEQDVLSDKGISKAVTAQDNGTVPKIVVEGSLNVEGWHKHSNEVIGIEGISPCIIAQSNNTKTKIVVPDIEIKGKLNEKGHFDCIQRVYGKDGASPTVTDHVPMMEDDD